MKENPKFIFVNIDELVKSRKTPFFVIPAPHLLRDKLQPVKDSDLSENPVFSISCRVSGLRFSPE
ncbi:MAG: hypothetical protein B1H12_03445 [Desulfobacteraceae bacterium 4484_190.2]|nr:MAG: hypothetical protein B1H12_03445 [Desulfobacteraceae bacterium 4484_190.2]